MVKLKHNPIEVFANSTDAALRYSFENDILGHSSLKPTDIWQLKEAQAITKKQQPDGSWQYRAKKSATWSEMDYDQYEN